MNALIRSFVPAHYPPPPRLLQTNANGCLYARPEEPAFDDEPLPAPE